MCVANTVPNVAATDPLLAARNISSHTSSTSAFPCELCEG
jgi:hypothetical protein